MTQGWSRWLTGAVTIGMALPLVFGQLPGGFTDEGVVTGLDKPIALSFLPDGQLLLVQKGGEILRVDLSSTPAVTSSYLTITDIDTVGERGLLDLALDPNYATNGQFYVYYSNFSAERFRIARFVDTGGVASLVSETVIWEDNEDVSGSAHLGGGLDFGPDGCLYLTTGDEFEPGQAPNLARAGGKIIRIHRDGAIPIDNPFQDGPGGNLDEIWAYGLRNPFRARWDLETERFFVAEVGGNESISWEDVHIATAGANLGWPQCEGPCLNPDFPECICGVHDDPLFRYPHTDGGAAVIGGIVYRGNQFPATFQGAYFYGDYVRGQLRYLTFDPSGETVLGDTDFLNTVGPIVALEQGPDGSLYYANLDGDLRRIIYNDGNQGPVIQTAAASLTSGPGPLQVQFSGQASDAEGDPLHYRWVFGDGGEANQPNPLYTYNQNGVYEAQLEVSDAGHTVLSAPLTIRVGMPPAISITSPPDGLLFRAGETIAFHAVASDPDGTISDSDLAWNIRFLHNDHTHPAIDLLIGSSGELVIPSSGHDFSEETGFRLTARVTDADGLITTQAVTILPDKVDLLFDTNPSGLTVEVNGLPRTTPYVLDTLIGFRHEIRVPAVLCGAQPGLVFANWSQGGGPSQFLTTPDQFQAYTATYVPGSVGDCNGNALPDTCELREPRSALFFDGNGDLIDIPDQNLPGDFTLEAWVLLTGKIDREDGLVGQDAFGQDINFSGRRFRLFAPGDAIVANTQHVADTWTHYALVRTGTVLTLYVNGVEDATGELLDPFIPKVIGTGTAGEGSIFGALDEVRLWNVARTPAEIADTWNRAIDPQSPGLLLYYSFNDDMNGQVVLDATAAGNHGTRGRDPVSDESDPFYTISTVPLLASADCDGNGVPDECQPDSDGDGLIDACDQFGDVNLDGVIDALDLPGMLTCMHGPDTTPNPAQPFDATTCLRDLDADSDNDVDLHDLAIIQTLAP